jgi:hypothetical protein
MDTLTRIAYSMLLVAIITFIVVVALTWETTSLIFRLLLGV